MATTYTDMIAADVARVTSINDFMATIDAQRTQSAAALEAERAKLAATVAQRLAGITGAAALELTPADFTSLGNMVATEIGEIHRRRLEG